MLVVRKGCRVLLRSRSKMVGRVIQVGALRVQRNPLQEGQGIRTLNSVNNPPTTKARLIEKGCAFSLVSNIVKYDTWSQNSNYITNDKMK